MAKKRFNIVRLLTGGAFFLATLVLLLAVGIVALTQSTAFRTWAVGQAIKQVNAGLDGKVQIGDVEGDVITGLHVKDLRVLSADGSVVVDAPSVEVHYQLVSLLKVLLSGQSANRIALDLILNRPTINLVRNPDDSTWNFARIIKPSAPKDIPGHPLVLTIDITALELRDASFVLDDRTVPRPPPSAAVDYSHLSLQNLNLIASGHIDPVNKQLTLHAMSFQEKVSKLNVRQLSGDFSLESSGVSAQNVRIETDSTSIGLNVRVDSLDLSSNRPMADWRSYPVTLSMDAPRISTDELKRFLPALGFLGGTPSLKLEARGRYGDIAVKRLELGLQESQLVISGRLKNLNDPDKLFLDLKVAPSRLHYDEVPRYIPGIAVPNLSYLGTVEMKEATFVGEPRNFTATFDAKTAVGSVRGGTKMDQRGTLMKYVADLAVVHGDMQPVLKNPQFHSDFTGRVVVNGQGLTLKDLNASVRMESRASMVAGRRYRAMYLDGTARSGGLFSVDTMMISWGTAPPPAAIADGLINAPLPDPSRRDLDVVMGGRLKLNDIDRRIFKTGPMLGLSGTIDLRNIKSLHYNYTATARDLNIADLTLNPGQASRLTFVSSAQGSGTDPDKMEVQGFLDLQFAELPDSRPSGIPRQLPRFALNVLLTPPSASAGRQLTVESDLVNLYLNGQWKFATILPGITQGMQSLVNYIGLKSQFQSETPAAPLLHPGETIDAEYDITINDISPLALFWRKARLDVRGNLRGNIRNSGQALDFSAQGRLDRFEYQADSSTLFRVSKLYITKINLHDLRPGAIEKTATADLDIRTDSTVQFNGMVLGAPHFQANMVAGVIALKGATSINNNFSVAVDGHLDMRSGAAYNVWFDTLVFAASADLRWRNVKPAAMTLGKDFIRVDSLSVQRGTAEVVNLSGGVYGLGTVNRLQNVKVDVTGMSLTEAKRVLRPYTDMSMLDPLTGKVQGLGFRVNGTLQEPLATAVIGLDSVAYAGSSVGDIRAQFGYQDQNLIGQLMISDLRVLPNESKATVAATIRIDSLPVDLAIAPRQERIIQGRPVKISAVSTALPLALLQPFLPGTRIRAGSANADFRVGGSFPNLTYSGQGKVSSVRALVEGNNLVYTCGAILNFRDNVLSIDKCVVRNDLLDDPKGVAEVTGKITFSGFGISDIDIIAKTKRLKVLSPATKAVNDRVYGDLTIASGDNPIRFHGSLDAPTLEGDMVVLGGNLTLPEYQAAPVGAGRVMYSDYQDWLRMQDEEYGPMEDEDSSGKSPADSVQKRKTTPADTATVPKGGLEDRARDVQKKVDRNKKRGDNGNQPASVPMADRIRYDLGISISQQYKLNVTMNFSIVEQLRASLKNKGSKLYFRRGEDGVTKLLGTLEVEDGIYDFIKKFVVKNSTLEFFNDLDNPRVKLHAEYSSSLLSSNGKSIPYSVVIDITGTKRLPEVVFSYTYDNRMPASTDREEINRDALTLLLFGRLYDELGSTNQGGDIVGTTAGDAASSIAAQLLRSLLAGTGIRELTLNELNDPNKTSIDLISQIGPVIVRYGGRISSPGDGKVTISMPLSIISDINLFRDFMVDLERESQNALSSIPEESYRIGLQFKKSW